MKAVFASFLAVLVSITIILPVGAQTRAMGARSLVLDDGSSHTLTVTASTMATNQTFTFPAVTTYTPGSVLFADGLGAINQNNPMFFWDNTNNRLGIGNAIPAYPLDVTGNIHSSGTIKSGSSLVVDGVSTPRSLTGDATTNITTTAGDIDITPFGNLLLTPGGGNTTASGTLVVTGNTNVGGVLSAAHLVATTSGTAAETGTGVTVSNNPIFVITGSAGGTHAISMPGGPPTTGDIIIVINESTSTETYAGTQTATIVPGASRTFFYNGTAWQ